MLDKLFSRKRINGKVSPKLRDIYMTLFKIKRNHSFVQVKFSGDEVLYQTMILDVDPDAKTLTIDELFPKDEGFVGMVGHSVSLTIRDKGLKISFETEVLKRGESDGVPLYVVRLPSTISKDQRRGAFRVDVVKHTDVQFNFKSEDYEHLFAKISNISATGVRLEIEGDQSDVLKLGMVLHDCNISLADYGDLSCSIDLRNLIVNDEPYHHTLIGGKFVSVDGDDSRILDKFLIKQQRKNLRESPEEAA